MEHEDSRSVERPEDSPFFAGIMLLTVLGVLVSGTSFFYPARTSIWFLAAVMPIFAAECAKDHRRVLMHWSFRAMLSVSTVLALNDLLGLFERTAASLPRLIFLIGFLNLIACFVLFELLYIKTKPINLPPPARDT